MTDSYTAKFQLTLPDFNSSPWHAKVNNNFTKIDSALFRMTAATGIVIWENDTDFGFGAIAIDPADATVWLCGVAHTSAAMGTFAADRAANPTYWTSVALTLNPRGPWLNETFYFVGDIVTESSSGITALCLEAHESSPLPDTIEDDAAYWSFIIQANAGQVPFDNGPSGMDADNVQDAIEEIYAYRFPVGTVGVFGQTLAPTGWTKVLTENDYAVRMTTGVVGTGGTTAFTTVFASGRTSNNFTLTSSEVPNMNVVNFGVREKNNGVDLANALASTNKAWAGGADYQTESVIATGVAQGGGAAHAHGLPTFAVNYVDVIRATKDAY
jgi:hypothetical protein